LRRDVQRNVEFMNKVNVSLPRPRAAFEAINAALTSCLAALERSTMFTATSNS
jgi:hypothetical protein